MINKLSWPLVLLVLTAVFTMILMSLLKIGDLSSTLQSTTSSTVIEIIEEETLEPLETTPDL